MGSQGGNYAKKLMRYYYHPESDSLWNQPESLLTHDGLVEEISKNEYEQLLSKQKGQRPMMLNFDARQYNPEQGIPKHPTGKFPAIISEVKIEGKSDKEFAIKVLFTTPEGQIRKQYNVASESTEANMVKMTEIARNSLAALCHAVGIFVLPTGQELVNARCQIGVTPQIKNPEYHEVSKVYDANGNEPGKLAPAPQPAQGQGGWVQNAPSGAPQQPVQQPAQAQPANGGWQPQTTPASTPASQPGPSWQQGPSAAPGAAPAWAQNK